MKSDKGHSQRDMREALERLSGASRAPKAGYALLLALYMLASYGITRISHAQGIVRLFGNPVPLASLTGVFSSLANFILIFLVVLYNRPGFYTALGILMLQFPLLIMRMFDQGAFTSIPGIFNNLLTIAAIVLIYKNDRSARQYQRRLREMATTDRLSGLPNKFAATELVGQLVARGERFAIVAINLNNFRSINNTMGRGMGNRVLAEIGARWREAADRNASGTRDFVTCQGGNEYAIIVRDYQTEADLLRTISYYNAILEAKLTLDDYDYYITASYGYAEFPADAEDGDTLATYAYAALHEAKRQNATRRVCHFDSAILKNVQTLEMERRIRDALEDDRICYFLQPQFDISHRLSGFEALARMKDETGKYVSPGEFIPVAERVGLVDKIDRCVFRNAAMFMGELIKKTGTDITLSVNVSARHLLKSDFLDEVRDILSACGVPPRQIEIELTESVMVDSMEKALQCINELKRMGLKIAIDDFGTGYSSLSYLSTFPADLLKVDKSFIDRMNSSDESRQYVAAIISIGHIMKYDVITEGVERPEQLETLRSIGCDYIQGFIWGRPMPPEDAEALVMAA